ncbi:MAG: FAD:protein FMN transferase [Bacteroidales bacterium]
MSSATYRNLFSMGTRMDIVLPETDDYFADQLLAVIKEQLQELEDRISIYNDTSVFSKLNREASSKPVIIDPDIFQMIEELAVLSEKTRCYFDFTIGKILELKRNKDTFYPGDGEQLKHLLEKTGIKFLKIDRENLSVKFKSPYISLDSGAFGKGAALDAIKTILNKKLVNTGFISFGESSILAIGSHPFGDSWKTGITNMFNPKENVYLLELKDEFMSVSGITPQNLKKYGTGHILNPKTAEPVNSFRQSAVAGKKGLVTEALSTALLCAPEVERDAIMDNFPGYKAVIIEYDASYKSKIVYS